MKFIWHFLGTLQKGLKVKIKKGFLEVIQRGVTEEEKSLLPPLRAGGL